LEKDKKKLTIKKNGREIGKTFKVAHTEKIVTSLGDLIRAHRLNTQMIQNELATLLGVNQGEVSKWEKGVRRPEPVHMGALAILLDIPLDILGYYYFEPSNDQEQKKKEKFERRLQRFINGAQDTVNKPRECDSCRGTKKDENGYRLCRDACRNICTALKRNRHKRAINVNKEQFFEFFRNLR